MLGDRSSARTTSPLQKTTTSATSLSATAGFRMTLRCVSQRWLTPAYFSMTAPIFSSTYLRASVRPFWAFRGGFGRVALDAVLPHAFMLSVIFRLFALIVVRLLAITVARARVLTSLAGGH